ARALRDAPVAVLGAGSWGTALAIQFARGGRPVRLWGRDRGRLADMAVSRRNERYLASAQFPDSLQVEPELATALAAARDVLIVVPSHAFRSLLAERDTFMGLAGLGDLVLTCTDDQSRNRRFGLLLAAGRTAQAALAEIGQAVEGYAAAVAIHEVASRAGVEMPLCEMAYRVLYQRLPAREAVRSLMSRPIKAEAE